MKKISLIILTITTMLMLSSCFLFGRSTIHPNMVEYSNDEVLEVAKEKYGVTKWIYTDDWLNGEAWYDAEGNFKFELYDDIPQYSIDVTSGDNMEAALTAFAGKNGGHDIQGYYSTFLCYVALGECQDDNLKFVYYNTNIDKDAEIGETIGASDYTLDVLPIEITEDLFIVDSKWHDMVLFMNKIKENTAPEGLIYSRNRLVKRVSQFLIDIEFYKENGKVVYDIYHYTNPNNNEDRRIVYSTSNRYGVIYDYYGIDASQYFNITQTVTQSQYEENIMILHGFVETKEIDGAVLYSNIDYRATYYIIKDDKVIERVLNDSIKDTLNFSKSYGIEKIDGIDHTKSAEFSVYDFYIFYEKNESEV